MKRAHVLSDAGLIVNTILVPELVDGMIDADLCGGAIGDYVVNGEIKIVPPQLSTPPEPPPPAVVTMRQAQLALLDAGMFAGVIEAIAAIADPDQRARAEIEWSTAKDVERSNPFTQFMADALDLSDADLDALFRAAIIL